MSAVGSIWIEAIMLPFLFVLVIFLSSRFATTTEMNRRFLWLVWSTFTATIIKIIEFICPFLIHQNVFYAVMNINAYCLMRYIASYVRFENKTFLKLHFSLFLIGLIVPLLFHKNLYLCHLCAIISSALAIFFIVEGFSLQLIFQNWS